MKTIITVLENFSTIRPFVVFLLCLLVTIISIRNSNDETAKTTRSVVFWRLMPTSILLLGFNQLSNLFLEIPIISVLSSISLTLLIPILSYFIYSIQKNRKHWNELKTSSEVSKIINDNNIKLSDFVFEVLNSKISKAEIIIEMELLKRKCIEANIEEQSCDIAELMINMLNKKNA